MSAEYPFSPEVQIKFPYQISLIAIVATIFLLFAMVGCKPTQPSDPIAVVQAAVECQNKGDVDCYMSYVADDVVASVEGGQIVGAQAFRDAIQPLFGEGGITVKLSEIKVNGNDVSFVLQEFLNGEPYYTWSDGLAVVVDGKIIFEGRERLRQEYCLKDPSQVFCP